MALASGIYRIVYSTTNTLLTLDRWASPGGVQEVTARPDEQDPQSSAAQQWVVTHIPESKTYTIFNVKYGLYLRPIYPSSFRRDIYITASALPCHWAIDVEPGTNTYSLYSKPTGRALVLWTYSAAAGTKAQTWPRDANGNSIAKRTWEFKAAKNPAVLQPAKPIVTLPSVQPGVYRIRNTKTQSLLTQRATVDAKQKYPRVVGSAYASNNDYQVWEIALHASSQTYFLKNRASGKFLHAFDYMEHQGDFACLSEDEGGKCHWDLRQGDYEGEFVIQIPGITWSAQLESSSAAVNTRVIALDRVISEQTWWFDPVNDPAVALSSRTSSVYLAPLKTGTYYIRNSASRTLLTQADAIATRANYKDPVVVGSPFQSDNDLQLWNVAYLSDIQCYTVQNARSGRYLSSLYGSVDGSIVTASEVKRPWSIKQSEANAEFTLRTIGSQVVIWLSDGGVAANTEVKLQNKSAQPTITAQRWLFEPADGTEANLGDPNLAGSSNITPPTVDPNYDPSFGPAFILVNQATQTVAAVGGNEKALVGNTKTGKLSQTWFFEVADAEISLYYLKTQSGGEGYLGINGDPQDGTPVKVTAAKEVRWHVRPEPQNGVVVSIYYPGTDLALDLAQSSAANGAPIILWPAGAGPNQEWKLESAQ